MTLNFSSLVSIYIWGQSGGGENASDPLTYTGGESKLLRDRSFLLFPHEQMDPMVQVCLSGKLKQ